MPPAPLLERDTEDLRAVSNRDRTEFLETDRGRRFVLRGVEGGGRIRDGSQLSMSVCTVRDIATSFENNRLGR